MASKKQAASSAGKKTKGKAGQVPAPKGARRALDVRSANQSDGPIGRCLFFDQGAQQCDDTTESYCVNTLKGQWDPNSKCP